MKFSFREIKIRGKIYWDARGVLYLMKEVYDKFSDKLDKKNLKTIKDLEKYLDREEK